MENQTLELKKEKSLKSRKLRIRFPSIELLILTKTVFRFLLVNTDSSTANALRRVIRKDIPTMAIDMIDIRENTSQLGDEFLAHKLGLVPFECDNIERFADFQNCTCKNTEEQKQEVTCEKISCAKCSVLYSLKARNLTDDVLCVTTSDLKLIPDKKAKPSVQEKEVRPWSNTQLIVKLAKNQGIDITCTTRLGNGKEHQKWNPVATVGYQPLAQIRVDQKVFGNLSKAQKDEFIETCPSGVFGIREEGKKRMLEIEDLHKCTLCQACVKKGTEWKVPDLVQVSPHSSSFLFTVETNGNVAPLLIVRQAVNILKQKLTVLKESLVSQEKTRPS